MSWAVCAPAPLLSLLFNFSPLLLPLLLLFPPFLSPPAAGPSVYMLSVIIIAIPFGTEHTRSSKHNRIRVAFRTPSIPTTSPLAPPPASLLTLFPTARTLIKCKSSSLSCPTKIWPKRHGAHFEHIFSNALKTCQRRVAIKNPQAIQNYRQSIAKSSEI